MNQDNVTYFGRTDFRGQQTSFGIKAEDRSRHVYVIGKTGMGKSTLLENMAVQDIQNGEGMCFIDPHGSAIDVLIDYIPEDRVKDIVYFAPFDSDYPIGFNVMEDVDPDNRHLVVSGLMSTFKKIWVDAWSARMEHILNNTILALLEYPDSTLLGVNRMYADKGFREEVLRHVSDPTVMAFWEGEYAKWDDRYAREATAAIQNKIGQFTTNPLIRNIIGQKKSSFDLRDVMDNQKIFLVNLSKGRIGEQNSGLLGGMIITKLYLAAMSRAEATKERLNALPPFFFFVDEFQNFANDSFADILSEARKYKLNLTMAHQYIAQMEEQVSDAVFGNVGTTIAFRVGPLDAEMLEKVFTPTFTQEDIVNLGKFQIYLSLMIDGVGSKPFSANTLPPIDQSEVSYRQQVVDKSRAQFAKPRSEIQKEIDDWYAYTFETAKMTKERVKKEEYIARKKAEAEALEEATGKKPTNEPTKIKIPTNLKEQIGQAQKAPERKFSAPARSLDSRPPKKDARKPRHEKLSTGREAFKQQKPERRPESQSKSTKDPSDSSKSLLKSALAKALGDSKRALVSASTPTQTPFSVPVKTNHDSKFDKSQKPKTPSTPNFVFKKKPSINPDQNSSSQPKIKTEHKLNPEPGEVKRVIQKELTAKKPQAQTTFRPKPEAGFVKQISKEAPKEIPKVETPSRSEPKDLDPSSGRPKEVPEDILMQILQ